MTRGNLVAGTIITLLLCALPASAVVYVDSGASGSGSGLDWTNAFTTIQAGINAASGGGGDEVYDAVIRRGEDPGVDGDEEDAEEYGGPLADGVDGGRFRYVFNREVHSVPPAEVSALFSPRAASGAGCRPPWRAPAR